MYSKYLHLTSKLQTNNERQTQTAHCADVFFAFHNSSIKNSCVIISQFPHLQTFDLTDQHLPPKSTFASLRSLLPHQKQFNFEGTRDECIFSPAN